MTNEELHRLLDSWREGAISPEDFAKLEAHLHTNADTRRSWHRAANLDSALRDWAGRDDGLASWLPPTAARQRTARWLWAAAAAIALLASAAAYLVGAQRATERTVARMTPPERTDLGCAVLAQTVDVQWANAPASLRAGATLKTGRLSLRSGLAQIDFFSGATLVIEGPAELDIRSASEAACLGGKVRVRVPQPAQGFRLLAPGMTLVDLGTEFGLNVDTQGSSDVHVFEGSVEAHPATGAMRLLTDGMGLRSTGRDLHPGSDVSPADFTSIEKMNALSEARQRARFAEWSEWSRQARKDPRLVAYYPFKHWEKDRWDRFVNNFAGIETASGLRLGAAVGARWTQGRWPGKDAMEFKGPGDRVRIHMGRENYDAITLACWVCVEGLDRKYNALLLTDGYGSGEPHWQIYEDGRVMFSITYPDPAKPEDGRTRRNQIYYSPSVFSLANQRRWHHLAVTFDARSGEAVQYLDGSEISREVSPFHQPGRTIHFGPSEIGNWGLPLEGHQFPIRNLNGRIDEFAIYHAVLSAAEIARHYEAGKPE